MKIGVDARFMLRKQRGMPVYVTQLCMQLPKAMPDDTFVLYINSAFEHNDTPSEYRARLNAIQSMHNVTVIDLPHVGEMHWEWWVLPRELRNNPVSLLHMPGNRALLRARIPQIVTIHDTIELENSNWLGGLSSTKTLGTKLRYILYRIHIRLNYLIGMRRVLHILTISRFSQNNIVSRFSSVRNRSSFVYHGLPPAFANISNLVAMKDRKGVLMLGGDSDQKNCENAIVAWHSLSSEARKAHPLTIMGFVGTRESEILKTLEKLDIENGVNILGWVDDTTIVNAFRSSRAFLFVSKKEGFGFPLVQAMACGTPAVISQAEALVELGGEAMPSAPYDRPTQIAEQLQKLIDSDLHWSSVQVAGRQRLSLFHWDKVTKHISCLYRRIGTESKGNY